MGDALSNNSNIHPNFSHTMAGSVSVTGTPNWQKNSGHIPGTTPPGFTPVGVIKISDTAKQTMRFPNALEAVYHS